MKLFLIVLLNFLIIEAQSQVTYSTDSLQTSVGTFILETSETIDDHAIVDESFMTEDGGYAKGIIVYPVNVARKTFEHKEPLKIIIGPNPVADILNVELKSAEGQINIFLIGALGQIVYQNTLRSDAQGNRRFSIDMRSYPVGFYQLKINDHHFVKVESVIKS